MLQDTLGNEDGGYEGAESRAVAERLLRSVSARERLVLRLRFEEDLTPAEIGTLLGVSQMQVSRILHGALERLRHAADPEPRVAAGRR